MTPDDPTDPDAPPSEEEVRESARLREALDDPSKDHAGADLLRAVKNAASPKPLQTKDLDEAVARSLEESKRNGLVIRVVFGAGAALAAAAAIVFVFSSLGQKADLSSELAHARSTQPLFATRFESHGGESARIDRIAIARAADLRENHFARWGVREGRGHR
jgi:hypothetical protein